MYNKFIASLAAAAALMALASCGGAPQPVEPGPGPGPGPEPGPQPQAEAPRILSVTGGGSANIAVSAEDSNGDDITVTLSAPSGFAALPAERVIAGGGPATVEFALVAQNPLSGAPAGEASLSASDGALSSTARTVAVDPLPPLEFEDDTIYAFPLDTEVEVGEPVTIVIASGTPATPIYSPSVRIGMNRDWDYVPDSFNLGEPGGAFDELDGIYSPWPDTTPVLLPGDMLYQVYFDQQGLNDSANGAAWAEEFYTLDFTVWPMDEELTPLSAGGMLFNFEAVFSEPGEYTMDFVEFIASGHLPSNACTCIIPGPASEERILWGDSSNRHSGVPYTITVTEQ